MSEAEQRAWVEAARQGDEDAFAQIFYQYQVSLFNLARQMVGDPDEAEDVVQQTFIKAFRRLPRIRKPGSLEIWLKQILYTTSIDALRRRKRRAELPIDDSIHQRTGSARGPEQEAVIQEDVSLVQQAILRMPERYRACILLRDFQGLRYKEIAEIMGMPPATVRTTVFRAREELRTLLRQVGGEEPR